MLLVLNQYGNRLTCKKGLFQVKNDPQWKRISPARVSGICIAEPGMISTDAIRLAVKNDVPIVILSRNGKPLARLWQCRYGAQARIRRQQVLFSESPKANEWILAQLSQKTDRQIQLLQKLSEKRDAKKKKIKVAIEQIEFYRDQLDQFIEIPKAEAREKIMGLEGNAAIAYFKTISQNLPKEYKFKGRSRRPSKNIFNASLNYLYGMLYQHCEMALIVAGIDPHLPIWHSDLQSKPALVYDFVEPYRPWADWVITKQCLKQQLNENTHAESRKGGIWLNKEGKKVLVPAFEKYIHQKILWQGKRISRLGHLRRKARGLARMFLDFDQNPIQ